MPSDAVTYMIRTDYRPDALEKRDAAMPGHRAYLQERRGIIWLSGPFLAEDGTTPTGGLAIVEVPDRAAAEAFTHQESFYRAGMLDNIVIRRFVTSLDTRPFQVPLDGRPLYVCDCRDSEAPAPLGELPTRPPLDAPDDTRLVADGWTVTDDGSGVTGSLTIVEVPDRGIAKRTAGLLGAADGGRCATVRLDRWRFGRALA